MPDSRFFTHGGYSSSGVYYGQPPTFASGEIVRCDNDACGQEFMGADAFDPQRPMYCGVCKTGQLAKRERL